MRIVRVTSVLLGTAFVLTASCAQVIGAGDYHVTGQTDQTEAGSTCDSANIDQGKLLSIVSACVLLESCNPFTPSFTLSTCITLDVPAAIPFDQCALTANGCADLEKCLGYGYSTPQDCPSAGAFCNGNRAANCAGAGRGATEDCSILGGSCGTYTDANGAKRAGCKVVPTCTDTDKAEHCSGNSLYECFGGAGFGQNCNSVESCVTEGSQTSCFAKLPSCSLSGSQCQGDVDVLCTTQGKQISYDCTGAGLSCQVVDDDAGIPRTYCLAPGCTAADVDTNCTESCDGAIAHLCAGGAPVAVDCTSFGFTGCRMITPGAGASLTSPYAMCVPF